MEEAPFVATWSQPRHFHPARRSVFEMSCCRQIPSVRLLPTFLSPVPGEELAAMSQAESGRFVPLTVPHSREPRGRRPFPDRSRRSGPESFQASKRLSNSCPRRTQLACLIDRLLHLDKLTWLCRESSPSNIHRDGVCSRNKIVGDVTDTPIRSA